MGNGSWEMGHGEWDMGHGRPKSQLPSPNSQVPSPNSQKNPIPIRKNVIFVHLNGQQSIIWLCSSTDRIKDSGSLDLGSIPSRVASPTHWRLQIPWREYETKLLKHCSFICERKSVILHSQKKFIEIWG